MRFAASLRTIVRAAAAHVSRTAARFAATAVPRRTVFVASAATGFFASATLTAMVHRVHLPSRARPYPSCRLRLPWTTLLCAKLSRSTSPTTRTWAPLSYASHGMPVAHMTSIPRRVAAMVPPCASLPRARGAQITAWAACATPWPRSSSSILVSRTQTFGLLRARLPLSTWAAPRFHGAVGAATLSTARRARPMAVFLPPTRAAPRTQFSTFATYSTGRASMTRRLWRWLERTLWAAATPTPVATLALGRARPRPSPTRGPPCSFSCKL